MTTDKTAQIDYCTSCACVRGKNIFNSCGIAKNCIEQLHAFSRYGKFEWYYKLCIKSGFSQIQSHITISFSTFYSPQVNFRCFTLYSRRIKYFNLYKSSIFCLPVCLPACLRPINAGHMAQEISHNKGNSHRFTKLVLIKVYPLYPFYHLLASGGFHKV